MKDNLTHILEAFENNPSLSNRFDSAPLFNNVFTNMPELENFRLTFNLFYRQLYLDSASAEDFFNRIVFYNRFPEEIAELVDSIEKFHSPIKVENEFFAFQDFFDILITHSRYLENLNVRSFALEAKSILSSERILTADIPAKKLPPITLEEEQFFAEIGDIEFELLRATIFTSFVNARESELVSKAFQFFDRSRISDDEIKKLLNVSTEEDEFTALDDYMDIVYQAEGLLSNFTIKDYFLTSNPFFALDKISNSDLSLLEVRPGFISEIIDSLDEQKNFFGTSLFEFERLKDTFLKAKSFISSDKFFTDIFSQNFYGIAFTEAENEERKEELLELSAGGKGIRRTREIAGDDYSLVKFFVELNSVQDFSLLKDSFLTPALSFITKDSAFAFTGIDRFFINKNPPEETISISALRKDVFFFFKLAGILESFQIKDFFLPPAVPFITKDTVDIEESKGKTLSLLKTYPQFFHPKGSNRQFLSKISVYHPFYSPQDNPVQITGDVYRSAPAPWEDFVQIGSDGSGAGYVEGANSPRRYTWRVTPRQTDITRGSWVWFGGRWPLENIPGKRRINFLIRNPQGGEGLYTPFTGSSYLEYGPKWLKNAGIFEVHSKKSFENTLNVYNRLGSISKSFSALNDRFYIGEEDVEPRILPFYTENLNVLNPARKKFITELEDQFGYSKDSVAVIANDYQILRDLFYSNELVLDFLTGKGPRDTINIIENTRKKTIYNFDDDAYLKNTLINTSNARVNKDRFYGSELVHAVDFFPKKEEFLELSQSNHRLINNLSPETSFILANENKLSTKVDFIRSEISQDSTNVQGFTTETSGIQQVPFIRIRNLNSNFRSLSVGINVQNLMPSGARIQSYLITSINVIGPNEIPLRVKNRGEAYQIYNAGNNEWKTSSIYNSSILEVEALVPYTFDNTTYPYDTWVPTISNLYVQVTLDINFTGGEIQFTGHPSEFPFVNNIQSADPGSAFINLYCPGYFLELYVGEEGTYATF